MRPQPSGTLLRSVPAARSAPLVGGEPVVRPEPPACPEPVAGPESAGVPESLGVPESVGVPVFAAGRATPAHPESLARRARPDRVCAGRETRARTGRTGASEGRLGPVWRGH